MHTRQSESRPEPFTLLPAATGLHALSRSWWLLLLRGVASILFGIAAFIWPGLTVLALTLLYGAFAMADGILALGAALSGRGNTAMPTWWLVLIGLLGARLYGERVGRTTVTLAALFPGSFVFTFAYSEALMIALTAAAMLCLLDRRWLLAGLFAALTTATRPNGLAVVVACAVAAFMAIREDRDWRSLSSVLLAPIGFIAFQIWLGQHTGEAGVWFRVQREAWGEGASFGWTAVKNTAEAITQPLTSPTDTITAVSVVATVVLVWMGWKARLPAWMTAYSWTVIALMLAPATVTARPRFLYTAFPLLIGAAVWFEHRHRTDDRAWPLTMAACGAGLVALTGLYGVFGAIP